MIERLPAPHAWSDAAELAPLLAGGGLSARAAEEKAGLLGKANAALGEFAAGNAAREGFALFVPGRIEVLGKHTDYAGGRSLVAAIERGFVLRVVPRSDAAIRIHDAMLGETLELALDPELSPRAGHWANYPLTVARRVARNFPTARHGADIALASDLPPAAGMSSSSALIVAVFLALDGVNHLADTEPYRRNLRTLTDQAGYLGTIENGQSFGTLDGDRGVGTFGGSEDHTAILCSRPGMLMQYVYRPVRLERTVAMPAGYRFAVGASGVAAEKTGAARQRYNRAAELVRTIEGLWERKSGVAGASLAQILASGPDTIGRLTRSIRDATDDPAMGDALLARLEHFLIENEQLLPLAGSALVHEDLHAFGALVDQSQEAAEELLGNQMRATSYLAASARRRGAVAASAFGAGFGGSVWALADASLIRSFLAGWGGDYRDQFPELADRATFFATAPGPAAFRIG